MSAPKWGPVEERVMEDCFDPAVLRDAVPDYDDTIDAARIIAEMQRETNGFTADRSLQRVAHIDLEQMLLLEDVHDAGCSCGNKLFGAGGHKEWFLHWLRSKHGQMFRVTTQ